MSERPTDADLAEWRRLTEASTPGPWFDNSYSLVCSAPLTRALDGGLPDYPDRFADHNAAWHEQQRSAYEADPAVAWVPPISGDTATGRHAADRDFIAAARTAMPALLDEVARLRGFFSAEATGYERLYDEQSAQLRALWPLARAAVALDRANRALSADIDRHMGTWSDAYERLERLERKAKQAYRAAIAALPPDLLAELEADRDDEEGA